MSSSLTPLSFRNLLESRDVCHVSVEETLTVESGRVRIPIPYDPGTSLRLSFPLIKWG